MQMLRSFDLARLLCHEGKSHSQAPFKHCIDKFYSGPSKPPPKARRMSKSMAQDITTRIHEDIGRGLYECAICTNEVTSRSKVWSCKTCWTVFHMSCIQKWAKKTESTLVRPQQGDSGDLPPPRQWRCPGCNLPKDDMPSTYTCWCAKEMEPRSIPGLPPHSCGQTCGTERKCPHSCSEVCHAGPCSPCLQMGPAVPCFCGTEVMTKRCVETNYQEGWTCGAVCGDLMPCGEHFCDRPCHEGLCGSCDVLVDSRCYCGKLAKQLPCHERSDPKESSILSTDGETDAWTGSFDCEQSCGRPFDCGKHFCQQDCHQQTPGLAHCPFSPDVVNQCPCGKTSLADINCLRTSCEDKIPHCKETCERPLGCGHLCPGKCHIGDCMPCLKTVPINCRCGRTTSSTICHQGAEMPPQCTRVCKVSLNCGRHECPERCCAAEKPARERQKRKPQSMARRNADEEVEAEHICTRTCGRQLKCGNPEHSCQELCHKGPCGSCRDAIFDELSCYCGRTVIHPPLPCGTQPPACPHQCTRQKECGHPQVEHPCHMNGACPKCPYLISKTCMCGKSILKNQPCSSSTVNCGQVCGRRLRCGIHSCTKTCHKPGDCEGGESRFCPHPCGQQKTACDHVCLAPCHAPYPCKEDKPCQAKTMLTCECQNIKQEVRCMATKTNDESASKKTLPCNDECLRLQRNQKLAAALNISPEHTDDHIPYSSTTLDLFKDNVKWSQVQEREFRVFAADPTEKRLRFKPMSPQQRSFVHSLADDFGLDHESLDPEPHRHVAIFKTPRFVSAPMKTLSQSLKIRSAPEPSSIPPKVDIVKPFNALILSAPRFALTVDELRSELRADLATTPQLTTNIAFLPSDEIVIYGSQNDQEISAQRLLAQLKQVVAKTVSAKSLAGSVLLCRVDLSQNVISREDDGTQAGGWSQVVKGAALKKANPWASVGKKSAYTVLGSKAAAAKANQNWRRDEEPVVDDWETAVDGAEGSTSASASALAEVPADVPADAPADVPADVIAEDIVEVSAEVSAGVLEDTIVDAGTEAV